MGERSFDGDFHRELATFKYTRWAAELSDEQLKVALWAVGELGYRSWAILECLDRHKGELTGKGYPRARAALQVLAHMVNFQKPVPGDEFRRMIAAAIAEMESK